MKKFFLLISFLVTNFIQTTEVSIGFIGDIMLGRLVSESLIQNNDYSAPWGNLLPLLRFTDFNVANLETTLSTDGIPVSKVFTFQSDPHNAETLKHANIQVVNLANNHSFDFGLNGFLQTRNTLQNKKISFIGAGLNKQEAQQPAFITKNGLTFAFIGITDNEPEWAAGVQNAGINYTIFDENSARDLDHYIKNIKKDADFLVVSIHWGPNWSTQPSRAFQKFAHSILESGADLIHGHSPHIFQGIEIFNNKLIIYSAGDFLDDYAINSLLRNDQSFLFLTTFDQKGLKELRLIPATISNVQVNKASHADAQTMLLRMQKLSLELGTALSRSGVWHRSNK